MASILDRMRGANIGGSGWAGDPGGDLLKGRYDEQARRGSYKGEDGYIYTPIWEEAMNNASRANADSGGQATFGGYKRIKDGWKYGDMGEQYDAEGKKVGDFSTTAPDWIDKWGPRAALAIIGAAAGGALTNGLGITNFGAPGAEGALGQNGAFLGEGVSSGIPGWDSALSNVGGAGAAGGGMVNTNSILPTIPSNSALATAGTPMSLGAGGSAAAGTGILSQLGNALPGAGSLLELAVPALGALAGSQGQEQSTTTSREPWKELNPFLLGDQGILRMAQQQAQQGMPQSQAAGARFQELGGQMLGTKQRGSGFDQFMGRRI